MRNRLHVRECVLYMYVRLSVCPLILTSIYYPSVRATGVSSIVLLLSVRPRLHERARVSVCVFCVCLNVYLSAH